MSTKRELTKGEPAEHTSLPEECFIIMPISDQPNYDSGHFSKVYEDIFKPACLEAGYEPRRADDVKQSNLIHLDILKRVVNSPMAICDLSGRNPNVLFELGLRQAFDKPTILVKDLDTPEIFDIAPIRYTTYRRELRYREVLFDQKAITEAIRSTRDEAGKSDNVNSLIRLLELSSPATTQPIGGESEPRELFQILMAEISQLKREFRRERASEMVPLRSLAPDPAPAVLNLAILRTVQASIESKIEGGASASDLEDEISNAIKSCERFIYLSASSGDPLRRSKAREAKAIIDKLQNFQLI